VSFFIYRKRKKKQAVALLLLVCKCGGRTVGARYYNLTDSQDKREGNVFPPSGEKKEIGRKRFLFFVLFFFKMIIVHRQQCRIYLFD
jgi:hypothetical protein